jgi:hypothetical protein
MQSSAQHLDLSLPVRLLLAVTLRLTAGINWMRPLALFFTAGDANLEQKDNQPCLRWMRQIAFHRLRPNRRRPIETRRARPILTIRSDGDSVGWCELEGKSDANR